MKRQAFAFNIDTGAASDTGPPIWGTIRQIGWNAETNDTGGDLSIRLMPAGSSDTGLSFLIYSDNDVLGTDFIRPLVHNAFDATGFDSGVDEYRAYVAAGDRLSVKVDAGEPPVKGIVYVWVDEK